MKNFLTTVGITVTLALPHAAQAQVVTPRPEPTNIEVPAPDQAFILGRGFGTQNYECQPLDSLGRIGWVLFTPQAALFGARDEQLITPLLQPQPVRGQHRTRHVTDSRDTSIVGGSPSTRSFPSRPSVA